MVNIKQITGVTGYDPYEKFFASRYTQGGRRVHSLDWSVSELVTFLPKPDPNAELSVDATQRKITPAHAKGFGDYVREEEAWVSPALLLQAPNIFQFEPVEGLDAGSTQFGILGVPKDARGEIRILDGQHRTLGFHLAWESLSEAIVKARATLQGAKESGDPVTTAHAEQRLNNLISRRDTLARERVSVQIVEVLTPEDARRMFVDINDNAKGVTGAVKSRFDDRKVVNRALNIVLKENSLLDGRVDLQQDRVSGKSPYLLGAKHVADILRALQVGAGRIGKRLEDELVDKKVAEEFDAFVEVMTEAFTDLGEVEDGEITPAELREKSLIGSNVMLRAFAIAWHELKQDDWTEEEIKDAFADLESHMSAPVYARPGDTWFDTGLFAATGDGAYSPTSRIQDLRALGDFIVEACTTDMVWHRKAA